MLSLFTQIDEQGGLPVTRTVKNSGAGEFWFKWNVTPPGHQSPLVVICDSKHRFLGRNGRNEGVVPPRIGLEGR